MYFGFILAVGGSGGRQSVSLPPCLFSFLLERIKAVWRRRGGCERSMAHQQSELPIDLLLQFGATLSHSNGGKR